MREGHKQQSSNQTSKDIFGVNFHDFIEKDQHLSRMEMAQEFGVSLKDIKKIKESLNRA
ncbi:RNA polymerase subunit sigma-70 [Pontibacillus sp. HMF3514]|uniref:RNA polymerase subunit sigma-70 n=1 Tax=Pontibacillus sp. HMF3514 TaxID=2692425 RepID=UPI001F438AF2|nr:RNA polymerase subunit sigma-70 [Pontibacillus sp. HMF3514]